VLQGVSRGVVFDLGRTLGIPVVEEDLQPYDVYNADEAFFTSTSPCILPVTRVDRRAIGDGKPGPVVGRLLRAWSELVGVDIVEQARRYAPRERQESKAGS
jgi:branched-subunit amino acid aminotransferase/4-amino-4-deoxychorismate lyase